MPPSTNRHIVIITHEYFPVLCGGTTMAHKLAVQFAALGHTAEIWTGSVGLGLPAFERRDGIVVRRFCTGRFSIDESRLWEHLTFTVLGLPQMLLALWRHPADTLLSIFVVPSGFIGLMLSWLTGRPSFVHVDAADIPGIESAMKRFMRFLGILVRFVSRHSAGMIVTGGLEDLAAPYMTGGRVTVVATGLDIPAERAMPGNPADRLRFLSVGRLVRRKGFVDLVRAFALARAQRQDFLLTIVGAGPLEQEIRAAIREHGLDEHVLLAGRVEYDRLREHYLNADCYIFYGGREGSSLALIEALGYGLPLIASDDPGNRLYIEPGRNGLLAEYGRPERLAESILQVLDHRELLPSWGRRSREIAGQYTWRGTAERYLEFFDEAAGSGPPPSGH